MITQKIFFTQAVFIDVKLVYMQNFYNFEDFLPEMAGILK